MRRLAWLLAVALSSWSFGTEVVIRDAFDRDVTKKGITLLDWDGQIANPAIKLKIEIKKGSLPNDRLELLQDSPRILFSRCNEMDTAIVGRPVFFFSGAKSAEVWVSIFPDRDGKDELHHIEFRTLDGKLSVTMPVRVIDQDKNTKPVFNIVTDFSEDKTGFLSNPKAQEVIKQAAAEWAYFIDDMAFDTVPAEAETSTLWKPDGFISTYKKKNKTAYNGFLVYFTGIAGEGLRSGGSPSYDGKRQTSKGKELGLLRSGAVEVEIQGNYHRLGYFIDNSDDNWWCTGSGRYEPADFLSVMMHELGHALAFESNYPVFGAAMKSRKLVDPEVRQYLGKDPALDASSHFFDSVDPASGFGVFGNEYGSRMKVRRWLITKAHLLLLKAVGYKLRPVSCFDRLEMVSDSVRYSGDRFVLEAKGGIPDYLWEVVSGSLPDGVKLDALNGCLVGKATRSGTYKVRLRVTDQGPTPEKVEKDVTITVG